MTEAERIQEQLRRALDGGAWHGPSLAEVLSDIDAKRAHARPLPGAHTIAELVAHVAVWLDVPARRLAGEAYEPDAAADWPRVTPDEAGWQAALARLGVARAHLVAALRDMDTAALDRAVPGRDYDARFMLYGVLQHVAYHGGQIMLLACSLRDAEAGGVAPAGSTPGAAAGGGAAWLAAAVKHFLAAKELAGKAAARLDDDEFFAAPDPETNSVAIIMKHMAGNLRSRWTDYLTTDGEKPDRDRDGEFELRDGDTRAAIMAAWEEGWRRLFDTLASLRAEDLDRTVHVRGQPLTVADSLLWQLAHHAGHVGQIVYRARLLRAQEWESLSIPRRRSLS